MSDKNKRYYWLKLPEDFFEEDTMKYIEEQPNGVLYSNLYLKLCLHALRNDGYLVRLVGDIYIPYTLEAIATLTRTDIDTVRSAIALFKNIGLIKFLQNTENSDEDLIYFTQIEEMIGSETDKARLMRKKRARDKFLNDVENIAGNNVTEMLPECYPRDIENRYIDNRDKESIDIIDIEKESESKETLSQDEDQWIKNLGICENVNLRKSEKDKIEKVYYDSQKLIDKVSCIISRYKIKDNHFSYINKIAIEDGWQLKDRDAFYEYHIEKYKAKKSQEK